MTEDSSKKLSAIQPQRAELARLCRQIALGQERGVASRPLEEELRDALALVREKHGPASVSEDELLDFYRRESSRVADAVVLAELLAPRLAEQLRPLVAPAPAPRPAAPVLPAPNGESVSNPPIPTSPLGIADLIEGMLDQDRHEARLRRPPARR